IVVYALPSHAKSNDNTPFEECIMFPFASMVKVSPVILLFATFNFQVPSHDGPAARQGAAESASPAHTQNNFIFIETSVQDFQGRDGPGHQRPDGPSTCETADFREVTMGA